MNTYLSWKERRYRWVFGVILVVYLIFLASLFLPQLSIYQRRKNSQPNLLWTENRKELWENYLKLKEEKAHRANKLRGLESKLNLVSESHLLITNFQKIFSASGVKLEDCSFGMIIDDQPYPRQKVSLVFTGQYAEIITSLTEVLNKSLYQSFNFTISPGGAALECFLELEVLLNPQLPGGQDES